jgi:hypothetical protein
MHTVDTPIATYIERRFASTREFRLYESYVELVAPRATLRFELRHLLPTPRTGSVIDATTRRRLWIANLTMLALWFVAPALVPEPVAWIRQLLSPLGFSLAKIGYLATLVLLAASALLWRRRYDFAEFEYEPGKAAFDMLKTATAGAGFQAFVESVSRAIASARAASSSGASQNPPQ